MRDQTTDHRAQDQDRGLEITCMKLGYAHYSNVRRFTADKLYANSQQQDGHMSLTDAYPHHKPDMR